MEDKNFLVMVVDDEPEIVETISTMVDLIGHDVISFTDPYRAVQQFMKTPTDLVITDLNMPHIDGFEMIKRMKVRRGTTQFIIVTGEKNPTTVFQSRNLGVSALFFKPISMEQLEPAIDRIYQNKLYWIGKLKEVRG